MSDEKTEWLRALQRSDRWVKCDPDACAQCFIEEASFGFAKVVPACMAHDCEQPPEYVFAYERDGDLSISSLCLRHAAKYLRIAAGDEAMPHTNCEHES